MNTTHYTQPVTWMLLALLACCLGCASIKPFKPLHYSRNLIVQADGSLTLDGNVIREEVLRRDLVAQMVFEKTPLAIHFHQSRTKADFDRIMTKIRHAGYTRYKTFVYRD